MEKQSETKFIDVGKATPEQIQTWKEAHYEVFGYKQEKDGEYHWSYYRLPSIEDVDFANSVAGDADTTKFTKALYSRVYLGGSEAAQEDARLLRGVYKKILLLCKTIEGEEVKL